jgi:hypothetical protein
MNRETEANFYSKQIKSAIKKYKQVHKNVSIDSVLNSNFDALHGGAVPFATGTITFPDGKYSFEISDFTRAFIVKSVEVDKRNKTSALEKIGELNNLIAKHIGNSVIYYSGKLSKDVKKTFLDFGENYKKSLNKKGISQVIS